MSASDPDYRLPIKIDTTSNGEYCPLALAQPNVIGNERARIALQNNARRLARSRREFLASLAGAATTLLAFDSVHAEGQSSGGRFALPSEAALDDALAKNILGGSEFIFDVQGHYVVPPSLATTLKPECRSSSTPLSRKYMRCLGADAFIKDVFLDSDTDMMVLSFVPSRRDAEPLSAAEAAATAEIVERMEGNHRLLIHGRVNPNQDGDLAAMDALAENYPISAWKCYTQWGPDGRGFFLSDARTGIPFIEKARRLGIKNICVHKGIPFGQRSYEHSTCIDIGPIAARYPDVNFLVYHSGYVPGVKEGPYDANRRDGIDGLIRSVLDAGLGHGSNVYAELGTTWRLLMRDPTEAAHAIGKLVKYLGEDNVLYGSDSVWYGSPQDQIQAFRVFEISAEFQERFSYSAMTAALRSKIFGLNAARVYAIAPEEVQKRAASDPLADSRENYRNNPSPHFRTYGPRTRAAYFDFLRARKDSSIG